MEPPRTPRRGDRPCAGRKFMREVFSFSLSEPPKDTGTRLPSNATPLPKRPAPHAVGPLHLSGGGPLAGGGHGRR
jgi:hypothetical protein